MADDNDLRRALADPARAAALVRAHHPQMWRAAYAISGRADIADEAVQDAFERMVRHAGRFDPGRPLGPWLHRIVANRTLALIERRQRRAEVALVDDLAIGDTDHTHQSLEVAALVSALASLPAPQRAAVVLRHLCGLSSAEVGEALGVPAATVRSWCARAITSLRATTEAPDGD